MKLHALCAFALAGGLAACAQDEAAGPKGLKVAVAPLDYPGIFDVCYGITVFNGDPAITGEGAPDTVWSQQGICSQTYGSLGGGDITYIGTCDADPSGRENYVDLVLESIETENDGFLDDQNNSEDGDPDFENPCPEPGSCVVHFACNENQDTLVPFNLTIMRDAEQGFFDVAVNFDDIFCSTKFDNCNTDGEFIELLFGDADGESIPGVEGTPATPIVDGPGRDKTAVFALACTAGPGAEINTEILYSKIKVTCGDKSFTLPLVDDLGNGLLQGNNAVYVDVDGDGEKDHEVQYGLYYGTEQLNCDDPETVAVESCNKKFFNIALNMEDLPATGCFLSLQATAQDADADEPVIDGSGVISGTGTSYPFVTLSRGGLYQNECFHFGPGEGPLSLDYGTSKDLAGGTAVQVMCNGSQGGAAYSLPETFKNARGAHSTKETALVTTRANLSVFEGFGKAVEDPCSGKLGSVRDLAVYHKTDLLQSEVGVLSTNYVTISGFQSNLDAELLPDFGKNAVIYIGAQKGNSSVFLGQFNWNNIVSGGTYAIDGLMGSTNAYAALVANGVKINGQLNGYAIRWDIGWNAQVGQP